MTSLTISITTITKISLAFLMFLHVIKPFADTATDISYQNDHDYLALMNVKSKISYDPYGIMKSWNGSVHFCNWTGIKCGRRHRRVTSINLSQKGLVGTLSPSLGNLSFLQESILWNNTFQGKIPPEYGRLFRLKTLNLSRNSLEGEIPTNLSRCSNLVYLDINRNHLTGKIPEELGSLSKLKFLRFSKNSLTGRIPLSLGNLTSLFYFSVSHNLLMGEIPASLGQLRILDVLACGNNSLSGLVPPSIYNISSLSALSLGRNQLHGSLPPNLGLMLPHLQILQLNNNYFTGQLPSSLANASELQQFQIHTNRFNGKIVINFGGMQNLNSVVMSENNFGSGEADEMAFLSSMTNCSNLDLLILSVNQLRGILPEDIGNLSSQLQILQLDKNQIYGAIPSTIGKITSLDTLTLSDNLHTGTIPSRIGNLQKLQRLALGVNKLSGEIPDSLGNLTLLIELYLDQNLLQGAIPTSLGKYQNLLWLDLSKNMLSGTIPKEIFGISSLAISLNLYQNHLFGSLPLEIGELKNLVQLDFSENNLSGEIPQSIGKCTSLVNLSLAGNLLNGYIPSSLSLLRGLQNIDFSHNNLSGQIPHFLENFTLLSLNLSFNNLEGEVPTQGIFKNSNVLSVVGNKGLCGGIVELQLPKCHNSKSKKEKISSPIMIAIVTAASLFIAVIWLSYFYICSSRRRNDSSPASPSRRWQRLEVTYGKLFKATNCFSSENLIGMGSFGSVYKGVIGDDGGSIIAVKVINLLHRGAFKSFMHECEALRNIRHRNLLKIITCCSSIDFQGNDFKALVYEFMSNGSLENWLHPSTPTQEPNIHHTLSLVQRINIAIDVACGLDYLHHHCERQIVHSDIKPSNILLDQDMTAHIGDFGLAKFLPLHTNANDSSSIGIRGSIGYIAPEYGLGTEMVPHGDIYSYGILLLEMMTGKCPTDPMFAEGLNLHKFVSMAMPDQVIDIVDPVLLKVDGVANNESSWLDAIKGSKIEECFISIFQIGLACSMDSPQDRMNISNVVTRLQSIRNGILFCQGNPTGRARPMEFR